MLKNETKHALIDGLARLYPREVESREFVDRMGNIDASKIAFENQASLNWYQIITYVDQHGKVGKLLEVALAEYPEHDLFKVVSSGVIPKRNDGSQEYTWQGDNKFDQEKIMGARSTLIDVNYLEIGVLRAKSVVKIELEDKSTGSGFLINDNLLVTNNHVLSSIEIAKKSSVRFNYQKTIQGTTAPTVDYSLDPDKYFKTDKKQDMTIVAFHGNPSADWPALELKSNEAKMGDLVNVIQHAGGGLKQISMSPNVIAYIDDEIVQYLTDTLPGSSGSPVFDKDWNVIAIHHSGGWVVEPADSGKSTYYRNQGASVDQIMLALES